MSHIAPVEVEPCFQKKINPAPVVVREEKECCIQGCPNNDPQNEALLDGLEGNNKVKGQNNNGIMMFGIPKDAGIEVTLGWIKIICSSCPEQSFDPLNDQVCINHFKDEDIQKFDTFQLHGKKYSVPKSPWTVEVTAVPYLFDSSGQKVEQKCQLLQDSRFDSEPWYWCQTCNCFFEEKGMESHIQTSTSNSKSQMLTGSVVEDLGRHLASSSMHSMSRSHRIVNVGLFPVEIRLPRITVPKIANYTLKPHRMKLRPKSKKSYSSGKDEDVDDPDGLDLKARRKPNKDDDGDFEPKLLEKNVNKRKNANAKNDYFYFQYCGICVSPAFTARNKLGQHMKFNHLVNGRYECPHCSGFKCTSVKRFNEHHNKFHMQPSKEFKKRNFKQKVQSVRKGNKQTKEVTNASSTKRNGPITDTSSKAQLLYCLLCVSPAFNNQRVYSSHMKQIHMINESYYECPHCKCKYGSVTRLNEHLKNNHLKASGYFAGRNPKSHSWNIEPFTCKQSKCNFMCRRLAKFQVHMEQKHNGIRHESMESDSVSRKKRFTCSVCNLAFRKRDHLKRHVYRHLKKSGLVPEFSASTLADTEVKKEVELIPSSSLVVAPNILPHEQIPMLEKVPKFESDADQEPIIQNAANHPNSNYMKELIRILGPQYKGQFHVCHLCPEIFKRFLYLKKHLKANHGVDWSPNSTGSPTSLKPSDCQIPKVVTMSCGVCGLTTANSSELDDHMKAHFGGRNYPCSYCGVRFFTEDKRSAHVKKIHQTARKFACNVCAKKYTTAENLRSHKRYIHCKRSRLQCDQCDKSYLGEGPLQAHKDVVHKDRPVCQICGESRVSKQSLGTTK